MARIKVGARVNEDCRSAGRCEIGGECEIEHSGYHGYHMSICSR